MKHHLVLQICLYVETRVKLMNFFTLFTWLKNAKKYLVLILEVMAILGFMLFCAKDFCLTGLTTYKSS